MCKSKRVNHCDFFPLWSWQINDSGVYVKSSNKMISYKINFHKEYYQESSHHFLNTIEYVRVVLRSLFIMFCVRNGNIIGSLLQHSFTAPCHWSLYIHCHLHSNHSTWQHGRRRCKYSSSWICAVTFIWHITMPVKSCVRTRMGS